MRLALAAATLALVLPTAACRGGGTAPAASNPYAGSGSGAQITAGTTQHSIPFGGKQRL